MHKFESGKLMDSRRCNTCGSLEGFCEPTMNEISAPAIVLGHESYVVTPDAIHVSSADTETEFPEFSTNHSITPEITASKTGTPEWTPRHDAIMRTATEIARQPATVLDKHSAVECVRIAKLMAEEVQK